MKEGDQSSGPTKERMLSYFVNYLKLKLNKILVHFLDGFDKSLWQQPSNAITRALLQKPEP